MTHPSQVTNHPGCAAPKPKPRRGGRAHEAMTCLLVQVVEGTTMDAGSFLAGRNMAQLGRLGALGKRARPPLLPVEGHINTSMRVRLCSISTLFVGYLPDGSLSRPEQSCKVHWVQPHLIFPDFNHRPQILVITVISALTAALQLPPGQPTEAGEDQFFPQAPTGLAFCLIWCEQSSLQSLT